MIDARYWLSRPLTQRQRDWCRRKEPEITLVFLIAVCFVATIAVNSCAASGPTVETYQTATVRWCGFRPSADTVRQILAVKNEALADPDTMALAICQARNLPLLQKKG